MLQCSNFTQEEVHWVRIRLTFSWEFGAGAALRLGLPEVSKTRVFLVEHIFFTDLLNVSAS